MTLQQTLSGIIVANAGPRTFGDSGNLAIIGLKNGNWLSCVRAQWEAKKDQIVVMIIRYNQLLLRATPMQATGG